MENYLTVLDKAYMFIGIFLVVCILVIAAIMIDLWDGVYTAKKTGQGIHSHKLRVTIEKMSEYWRFIVIGFIIDCIGIFFSFYALPFLSAVFGVGLIIVEAKSLLEHARRRKSHAAELPAIIESIINCAHENDAKKIIEQLSGANAASRQNASLEEVK